MDENIDIQRLIALRKLTSDLSQFFQQKLEGYLINLAPLVDPRSLLGSYIRNANTKAVPEADKAYQQLRELYKPIAIAPPFSLPADLTSPLDIFGALPTVTPVDYQYEARDANGGKRLVTISTPFNWVLTYKGLQLNRLRDLVANQTGGNTTDLVVCILHYLCVHLVAQRRPGIAPVLEGLRFPIRTVNSTEFGGLPLTYVGCPLSTVRPPDPVIIESTEISGINAFEEIIDLDDIQSMRDPLRSQVMEVIGNHSPAIHAELDSR